MARSVEGVKTRWVLPEGSMLSNGMYLLEARSNFDETRPGDQIGDWARNINNYYEAMKGPLIMDGFGGGGLDITDDLVEARYMIPTDIVGTGLTGASDVEGLTARARSWVSSGTGTLFLITEDDNSSVSVSNTTEETKSIAKCDLVDDLSEQEIRVQLSSPVGETITVRSLEVNWDESGTTLPEWPYSNDFVPLDTFEYVTKHMSVSVAKMRWLIQSLNELRRRRIPRMVATTWFTDTYHRDVAGDWPIFRCLAFQPPRATSLRVWIYGAGGTSGGGQGGGPYGFGHDFTTFIDYGPSVTNTNPGSGVFFDTNRRKQSISWSLSDTLHWRSVTVPLEPHVDPFDRTYTLTISAGPNNRIQGICAWYEALRV